MLVSLVSCPMFFFCFSFNDPATTEIYTLSLHDALLIYRRGACWRWHRREWQLSARVAARARASRLHAKTAEQDRKSTRLNSSHLGISYAVFCLKKKKTYISLVFYDMKNQLKEHD